VKIWVWRCDYGDRVLELRLKRGKGDLRTWSYKGASEGVVANGDSYTDRKGYLYTLYRYAGVFPNRVDDGVGVLNFAMLPKRLNFQGVKQRDNCRRCCRPLDNTTCFKSLRGRYIDRERCLCFNRGRSYNRGRHCPLLGCQLDHGAVRKVPNSELLVGVNSFQVPCN
jgi:hypothetical protein